MRIDIETHNVKLTGELEDTPMAKQVIAALPCTSEANTWGEAYETLLLDACHGDQTLFKRAEQVEAAWSIVGPVLEAWERVPPPEFPNYEAGTWGPEASEALIAQDGRRWLKPSRLGANSNGPD